MCSNEAFDIKINSIKITFYRWYFHEKKTLYQIGVTKMFYDVRAHKMSRAEYIDWYAIGRRLLKLHLPFNYIGIWTAGWMICNLNLSCKNSEIKLFPWCMEFFLVVIWLNYWENILFILFTWKCAWLDACFLCN